MDSAAPSVDTKAHGSSGFWFLVQLTCSYDLANPYCQALNCARLRELVAATGVVLDPTTSRRSDCSLENNTAELSRV